MENRAKFKIGVFGIIFDENGRILLCHRTDCDLWNLPGGGLEEGEVPWYGAIREVKEETGLEVKIKKLSGVYSKPDQNEIAFAFICDVIGGKMTLNNEADKIEYFELDKIPSNISPKQIERIKDAIENIEVSIKVQKGPSSIDLLKNGKI